MGAYIKELDLKKCASVLVFRRRVADMLVLHLSFGIGRKNKSQANSNSLGPTEESRTDGEEEFEDHQLASSRVYSSHI